MKPTDPSDFKKYAERIWPQGESKLPGQMCFVPADYDGSDDAVINKYGCTHYDIKWHERGESVLVSLYQGDAFGACCDLKFIGKIVIPITRTVEYD